MKKKNTPRTDRAVSRILALLEGRQLTSKQIAAELHCSVQGVNFYLRKLRAEPRRVRGCGFMRIAGRAAMVYELGTEPDTPYEKAKPAPAIDRKQAQIDFILQSLWEPCSRQSLMQSMGIGKTRMNVYLRELKANGKVFIHSWQRSRWNPIPLYMAGSGVDAPRPNPKSRAEFKARAKIRKAAWVSPLNFSGVM